MSLTRRTAAVTAALALSAASPGVAYATGGPPGAAAGTLTYTSSTFRSVDMVGQTTIISLTSVVSYTGTFQGSSSLSGILLLHPNGTAEFHDTEVFNGTVNGVPGTVTFQLDGTGTPDPNLPVSDVSATDTIVDATGQLAGMHGVLRETAIVSNPLVGPAGTYAGHLEGSSI